MTTIITTIIIIALVMLIVGYIIFYGLWWIFLWLTEYDGLYWLAVIFASGCVGTVVVLVVWSAKHLNLL